MVYAICLDWPAEPELLLHGLQPQAGSEIVLLGREGTVPWRADGNDTRIDLAALGNPPRSFAHVFKLRCDAR